MLCARGGAQRFFCYSTIKEKNEKRKKEERERKSRCDDVYLTVKPAGNQKYKVILGYKLEADLSYTTPCLKIEQGTWKDGSAVKSMTAFAEDLNLIPAPMSYSSQPPLFPAPGDLEPSGLLDSTETYTHVHMPAQRHVIKTINL